MDVICCTSKVYLEQLDCLVFSGKEYNVIPPHELEAKPRQGASPLTLKDLIHYEAELKKIREVTYKTKHGLQKTVKECCQMLKQKEQKPSINELSEIQQTFVNMLKILSKLITEGEDVTN